jgi:hypothetical protein
VVVTVRVAGAAAGRSSSSFGCYEKRENTKRNKRIDIPSPVREGGGQAWEVVVAGRWQR